MLTDKFIMELRAAFRVFGIDEHIARIDDETVEAGLVTISIDRLVEDRPGYSIVTPYGQWTGLADIDIALPRTAVMAVVEWHLKNPRQGSISFDV